MLLNPLRWIKRWRYNQVSCEMKIDVTMLWYHSRNFLPLKDRNHSSHTLEFTDEIQLESLIYTNHSMKVVWVYNQDQGHHTFPPHRLYKISVRWKIHTESITSISWAKRSHTKRWLSLSICFPILTLNFSWDCLLVMDSLIHSLIYNGKLSPWLITEKNLNESKPSISIQPIRY